MSEAATTTEAPAAPAADLDLGDAGDVGGDGPDPGSVEALRAELGLEEPARDEGGKFVAKDKTNGHTNGKANGKSNGEAAAAGEGEAAGEKPEPEDDAAIVRGIQARARARREAKAQAARPAAPPAAPAPAATAAVTPTPAAAPPPAGVTAAVEDVLRQIAKLAGEDEAAAAAPEGTPDPGKAARTAELADLKKIVEGLGAKLTEHETGLKTRLEKAEQVIEHMENTRLVRTHISNRLDKIEAEIPTLAGRRDAVEMVERAAEKYWDKYKAVPPIGALARRIEKKLAAGKDPPTRSGTTEKQSASRKTVSSSLGSPPAARSGPDTRSKAEIERDLFARFGVESDDDGPA